MALYSVFVTVGTTQFDKLIETVLDEQVLHVLSKRGCRRLVFQVGQGKMISETERNNIGIICFSLKPSINDDIANADLVISHAGAGSCLGVLCANKPLLVVINEDLMNNHQEELAEKLAEEKYLFKSNCSNLKNVLEKADFSLLKTFIPGDPTVYANYIDSVMGFTS